MNTLIVYDSVFGNTEKVAQTIGNTLGAQTLRVGDVQPEHLTGLDALIVGSPTRAFSPTPAIKAWLKRLPRNGLTGVQVSAFDTRASLEEVNSAILTFFVSIFGYAAKPIGNWLVKKGGDLSIPPEGFFVTGTEGPLKEGELERAANWAEQILL